MFAAQTARCANCDIEVFSTPYVRDKVTYCCPGCSRGGPCTCAKNAFQSFNRQAEVETLNRLITELLAIIDVDAPVTDSSGSDVNLPRIDDSPIVADVSDLSDHPSKYRGGSHRGWYEIGVDAFFNSRHFIPAEGADAAIQPRSWRVQAIFRGSSLEGSVGTLKGTSDLMEILEREASRFDDVVLNYVPPFDEIPPSAGNVAHVIHTNLKTALCDHPFTLHSVIVWETPTNYVLYSEDAN